MGLTRFYSRESGRDGPVSGALQIISVGFDDVASNETVHRQIVMPDGMAFYIVDVEVYSGTVASDPALTMGTTAAGTEIVASVNVTTNLGSLTLKSNLVTSGDRLDVRVVADADDTAENVSVTISGYVCAPPDSEAWRS